MNIIRTGFNSNKNNFFTGFTSLSCFFCIKYNFTNSSTRRSIYTLCNFMSLCHCFRIKARKKDLVYRIWVNQLNSSFFCYNTFFAHIYCNFYSSCGSSFTVTCLKYPEFTAFNSKFHILNIFIAKFKLFSNINILFIQVWHFCFKFSNRLWSSDTCNNIFTLCICKIFAVEFVFTCSRVTGK